MPEQVRYYILMPEGGRDAFLELTGLPYTDRQKAYDDARDMAGGMWAHGKAMIVYNLVEVARFGPNAYAINLKE